MNNNYENTKIDVEASVKQDEFSSHGFKKFDIVIFIVCLIIAFSVWCYASYLDDPIIKQEVTLNFVLENGSTGEYITAETVRICVYGEESVISKLSDITVTVDRSEFDEYNTDTLISLSLPEKVNSHEKQVTVQLNKSK